MTRHFGLAATTLVLAAMPLIAAPATASAAPQRTTTSSAASYICFELQLGGSWYCDFGETWYQFPNGTWQVFVIGLDYAVWTRWENPDHTWSGWTSMGGNCRSRVHVTAHHGRTPTITVTGMDGNHWHRTRSVDGHWPAWHR